MEASTSVGWHRSRRSLLAGSEPDLVILIDVPVEAGWPDGPPVPPLRLVSRSTSTADFHARVRAGYLSMAAADPERWRILDGTASESDVAQAVVAEVERLIAGDEPSVDLARTPD